MKKHKKTIQTYTTIGALTVMAVGRLNTLGSPLASNLFNGFLIPLTVGAIAGFLLGRSQLRWQKENTNLSRANQKLSREIAKSCQLVETLNSRETILNQSMSDLQKNQNYLKAIMNNCHIVMYLKDQSFKYVAVNLEYEKLIGKPANEIIGKTDFDLYPQSIAQIFRDQDKKLIANKCSMSFEEAIPLINGVRSFSTGKFVELNDEGNISAIGGACVDITDFKASESENIFINSQLKTLLTFIDDAILLINSNGTIITMNHKAEIITGWDVQEAQSRPFDEICKIIASDHDTNIKRGQLTIESVLNSHETPKWNQFTIYPKNGEPTEINIKWQTILDPNNISIGAFFLLKNTIV